jgi:hypothetical protein
VAQRLADPDSVERALVAGEEVAHLLGIELDELDLALAQLEETVRVLVSIGVLLAGLCLGQTLGDLDLLGGDGDAGDGAAELRGEVPGGAADTAPDIENAATFRDAGDVEKETDKRDLCFLLGEGLLGFFCRPVAVVDVFAPAGVRLAT